MGHIFKTYCGHCKMDIGQALNNGNEYWTIYADIGQWKINIGHWKSNIDIGQSKADIG